MDTIGELDLVAASFHVGPIIITVIATLFLYIGLRRPAQVGRGWLVAAVLLLVLVVAWVVYLTNDFFPSAGWLFAPTVAIFGAASGISAALVLVSVLPGRRKWAALGVGVVFPLLVLLATQARVPPTEAEIAVAEQQRNAQRLVDLLNRYYELNDSYPDSLQALVPDYTLTLPDTPAAGETGWLYQGGGEDFVLGYRSELRSGTPVCLYTAGAPQWECAPDAWGPFAPPDE
jgi:hypothetical protein